MSAGPSNQPAQERNDQPNFSVMQHLLEDGTFIDIPREVLRHPPPKPRELVYLQHHYAEPSGLKEELQECGSAEAAINALADELEGMRHVLAGYVHNFDRYVAHFTAIHDEMRADQQSRAESYAYMFKAVKLLFEDGTEYRHRVDKLEANLSKIRKAYIRPPPKFVRAKPSTALKNPEMTAEEKETTQARHVGRQVDMQQEDQVAEAGMTLRDQARFAELLVPPTPQPPASASSSADSDADKKKKGKGKAAAKGKGKGKQRADPEPEALDPRVAIKVEKLADGLVAMRGALQRVQDMEFQNLKHMRTLAAHGQRHSEENWEIHNMVDHRAYNTRKILESTIRHVAAYETWAEKCLEDQAAAEAAEAAAAEAAEAAAASSQESESTPAAEAATASSQESESTPTSDGSSGSRSSPDAATSTAATSSQSSHGTPPAGGSEEVYAVTVNVTCDKQFDELTREEAIELLKALPLRIHFTPCAASGDVAYPPAAKENKDVLRLPIATAVSASTAEHGEKEPIDVDEEMAVVQPQPQPQNRKRGRSTDDTEANDGADLRPATGGSPVKKKRV